MMLFEMNEKEQDFMVELSEDELSQVAGGASNEALEELNRLRRDAYKKKQSEVKRRDRVRKKSEEKAKNGRRYE